MKKTFKNSIYLFLAAALATGSITSCSDQLDLKPISNTTVGGSGQGTSGSAITDSSSAETALASAYAYFKTDGGEYYLLDLYNIGDSQSDNAYVGADNVAGFEWDEYRVTTTNSWVARDWGYLYRHITRCNNVINRTATITMEQSRKNQIIAEAKVIRARAYFDLVRLFGDVPLIVDEVPAVTVENLDKLYPGRTPAAQVYAQIIQDLTDAGNVDLPIRATKEYVSNGVVYSLLAEVYATQKNWAKVNEYTDKVIAQGYSLVPKFDELWDGQHENSSEAIWELNFTDWSTGGNWGVGMFTGTDWKRFCNPSNDMIKLYADEQDSVRSKSTITYKDNVGWTDKHLSVAHFPFFNKMRVQPSANTILYRLADILLLKAEAQNELGNTAEAAIYVNKVRDRAKLNPTTASTQADMRLAIEKERRLELAFEGHRWFDLLRTDRAIPVMQNVKDGNGVSLGYVINQNKLLWPVPQNERDKNKNLTQNAGY